MITRFAPSPTGPLHFGHAYSAHLAYRRAVDAGGSLLLRIEDIDQGRSRPEWEALIIEDLNWLDIHWPEPVMRQSERLPAYRAALESLWRRGLLYPCTCTRQDIRAASQAPQEVVPRAGPDGLIYPGTCRPEANWQSDGGLPTAVLRLNMQRAVQRMPAPLVWHETGTGPDGETGDQILTSADLVQDVGDVVLARRDMGTSYHLSVVIDDAEQGITDVIRGQDLFQATAIHVALQSLLGLPTPVYHHHPLVRDGGGRRLAKRDDARAIRLYRQDGLSPGEVLELAAASL
jgi:glutamyl-Q tRNA(Asp) synthetase